MFTELSLGHDKKASYKIESGKTTLICMYALPTAEILSGKNARAWVSINFT
jgi:hypothetical protein